MLINSPIIFLSMYVGVSESGRLVDKLKFFKQQK